MKAQMRYASSVGAKTVVIVGPKELENGVVTVRDMATAEQKEEPQAGLLKSLSS
jgi:histidyl-tRNA synthetase